MLPHRILFPALMGLTAGVCLLPGQSAAGESLNRRILPSDGLVVVELRNPASAIEHPLVKTAWKEAAKSGELRRLLASPDFDRARHFVSLIEQAAGMKWPKVLETLTAGGVAASFQPGKGGRFALVMAADSAQTMQRTVKALRETLLKQLPEAYRDKVVVTATHRNHDYYRVGKAAYAVVGRRLLFASTEPQLLKLVDRLLDSKENDGPAPGSTKSTQTAASLRMRLDLKALRQTPDFKKALKTPAENAGAVAFLGGWLDLLRRSDRLDAELKLPDGALELTANVTAGSEGMPAPIAGFFATKKTGPAPLLNPPRTIYSASWCRDYRSLWNNRRKLLAAATARKMEEGDQQLKKQLSVIGAKTTMSTLFSELGTQFRAVVIRQKEHDYKVDLKDRLPAAAIAIRLRDESKFREQSMSLLKGVSFILAVGEAKMMTRKTTHRGAELKSLRFRDDRVSAAKGNRIRFQFSPTFCITRGHFIAGSTAEVARAVIDELHKQNASATLSADDNTVTTELQRLSLSEAAAALKDVRKPIISTLTLNLGLSTREAEAELNVFAAMLSRLGNATVRVSYGRNQFQYQVRLQSKSR